MKISIVGAGKVGTALGIRFAQCGYPVDGLFSRTRTSSIQAAELIGGCRVYDSLSDINAPDLLILAVNDDALASVAEQVAEKSVLKPGGIAFHCSGALPAAILSPIQMCGLHIASVHPVNTFTDPVMDAASFKGTWCGMEGDTDAIDALEPLIQALGGMPFAIDGDKKALYHAAAVMVCNYLFPLIEAGLQCYEAAGVPRDTANQVISPILQASVGNCLKMGPADALTGPIARGDSAVVAAQLEAIGADLPHLQNLYKVMGLLTIDLAEQKASGAMDRFGDIRDLLR